jgi:hypothetical protein
MKRHIIHYYPEWRPSPMSFWVHREVDGRPWHQATVFEPPLPKPVPGKGFPYYSVEIDGFVFEFASLVELDACIATLAQKNLPSTDKETQERHAGPGKHWLNKLPGRTKPWRYRSKAVRYLHEARRVFEREITAP